MKKLFVEYTIKEDVKEAYIAFMKDKLFGKNGRTGDNRLSGENGVEWLESAEQPGLFLEVWSGVEDVEAFRRERKGEIASDWSPLLDMIVGGAAKINMWTFRPAVAAEEERGIRSERS